MWGGMLIFFRFWYKNTGTPDSIHHSSKEKKMQIGYWQSERGEEGERDETEEKGTKQKRKGQKRGRTKGRRDEREEVERETKERREGGEGGRAFGKETRAYIPCQNRGVVQIPT